jgi:hypothetical protein
VVSQSIFPPWPRFNERIALFSTVDSSVRYFRDMTFISEDLPLFIGAELGREPISSSGRRTSALVPIPDSSWTLRHFRKVPTCAAICT